MHHDTQSTRKMSENADFLLLAALLSYEIDESYQLPVSTVAIYLSFPVMSFPMDMHTIVTQAALRSSVAHAV